MNLRNMLASVLVLFGAGAHALDTSSQTTNANFGTSGGCDVSFENSSDFIIVFFTDGENPHATPQGHYYNSALTSFTPSGYATDSDAITSAALSGCFSSGTIISNLVQNGISSPFSSDIYYGFTFTATIDGVPTKYEFAMKDSDTASTAGTRFYSGIVAAANVAPTANAGPDQTSVASGATVTLAGAGTDTDGTIASYAWTRTGGTASAVTLSSSSAQNPTFTANTLSAGATPVTHIFSLIVTDNLGASSVADTVTITVNPPANVAPTANAGPDQTSVASGATVTLAGAGTDTDGTIASYAWTRTGGTASAVTLSSSSAQNPTFTANTLSAGATPVTHIFSLIVTDNLGASSVADTVTITVNPPANVAPTANAGPDQTSVASGATVTLAGAGTDTDGTIASYAWTRTGGTASAVTLSSSSAQNPTFTANTLSAGATPVTHIFSLIVTDNLGASSVADTVTITVNPPANVAPTANAGPDQTSVASGATVTLAGAGTDTDGTIASYAWTRTGGTASAVTLSSSSAQNPTFTANTLSAGATPVTHIFSLIVTDNLGASSVADTVTITVNPPVDTTAPAAPVVTGEPTTGAAGNVTVSGTVEPGSSVTITWPDGTTTEVTADASGAFEATSSAPQPNGDITITAKDAAGNVSNSTVLNYVAPTTTEAPLQTPQEIGEAIGDYQFARANALLNHQPDLLDRFTGNGEGSASLNVEGGNAVASFRTGSGHPLWLELDASRSEDNGQVSTSAFVSAGYDRKVNDNLLLGLMLQGDQSGSDGDDQSIKGTGYLVGPYFVAKLPDQELFLEGRALYGQSFNEYTPTGGQMDEFTTNRLLGELKVYGEIDGGNDLRIRPFASVSHISDSLQGYTNFEGLVIKDQRASITQSELGLNVSKTVEASKFTGGLTAVMSSASGTGFATSSMAPGFVGFRGQAELGFEQQLNATSALSLGLKYDGIGSENYSSLGFTLGLLASF